MIPIKSSFPTRPARGVTRSCSRSAFRLACFLTFASIMAGITGRASAGDDVVAMFRSLSPPAIMPSWVTPYVALNGARLNSTASPTKAVNAAKESYKRWHYVFDGQNDYVQLKELARAGDLGVTVRAWFNPTSTSGMRSIISTTQDGGYALRIVDGKVVGDVHIDSAVYHITSSQSVRTGKWNQATLVADIDPEGPMLQLTLVLNGAQTFKAVALSGAPRVRNSAVAPLIGAEPNADGKATTQFFKGLIEGAVVRNYPIELTEILDPKGDALWLFVPPPEDGTSWGGEPSYWDDQRTNIAPQKTVDRRYADSGTKKEHFDPSKVQIHGYVPFLNNEYVPQGIASSCEDAATCTNERLFVSMYWRASREKGTAGDLDLKRQNPSLIVELDPKNLFQPKACMRLQDTKGSPNASHVAGLGFFKNKLYVVTAGSALRYPLPDSTSLTCMDVRAEDAWKLAESGTLSFSGGFLLATDYCRGKVEPCKGKALAHVYEFVQGQLQEVATYAVPDYTEGLEFYDPDRNSTIARPDRNAELIASNVDGHFNRYPAAEAACSGPGTTCKRLVEEQLANNGKRLYLGDYTQDTAFNGTRIWSTSESGIRYLQRYDSTPPRMFPFVFSAIPTATGWETVPPVYFNINLPPPVILPIPRPPKGFLELASQDSISGWASDPDWDGPIAVNIRIDGTLMAVVVADAFRADVGAHGFSWDPPQLTPGPHRVEVDAIGVDRTGKVDPHAPQQLSWSPATYSDADFTKVGNNGTVTCSTFCEGAAWDEVGGCVDGVRTDTGQRVGCFVRPGLLPNGQELTCGCERGFTKPGNNGTVSCRTFCDGAQWGTVGRCVGAVRNDNDERLSCDDVPGFLGDAQLVCQCVPKLVLE